MENPIGLVAIRGTTPPNHYDSSSDVQDKGDNYYNKPQPIPIGYAQGSQRNIKPNYDRIQCN